VTLIPVETLVYQFLQTLIDRAVAEQPLYRLELHDNLFRRIKTDRGVRVGTVDSTLSLNPEGEIEEFSAGVTLVVYARIREGGLPSRNQARQIVLNIAAEITKKIQLDGSLGNRVCRARILQAGRDFDEYDSAPYAVMNLPIIINEM
jgi:hypothetical protein